MKLADNEIMVLDAIKIDRPRTKDMIKILDALGLAGQSVLIVLTEKDSNVLLSTRTFPQWMWPGLLTSMPTRWRHTEK